MKSILLLALVSIASAQLITTGTSTQARSQDVAGNYEFSYDESHNTGGTFRRESGNALGQVIGSYGLRDADGRNRIVNYIADGLGYRASILTNEPGTDLKAPAATTISRSPLLAPAAPVVVDPAYRTLPGLNYGAAINHGVRYF